MLNIQKWLKKTGGDLDKLESKFAISATKHPVDSRIIFNYSQIASRKFNPMVQECRGLVLDSNDWPIVAKGFNRFYNLGECRANDNKFDWTNANITEKADGTLILYYFYNYSFHVNTRSTFGAGEYNNITWRELFYKAAPDNIDKLDKKYTYVFELCSRYNRVVRDYPTPILYLTGMFEQENEVRYDVVDGFAKVYGLNRPQSFTFSSIDECIKHVETIGEKDHTYEGLVLRDCNNVRIKLKNLNYLKLHRVINNHVLTPSRILDIVLIGETDEMCVYMPELADKIIGVRDRFENIKKEADKVWSELKGINDKKTFANTAKQFPFAWALFNSFTDRVLPSIHLTKNPDKTVKLL